jgi:hypothetical protein
MTLKKMLKMMLLKKKQLMKMMIPMVFDWNSHQ